MRSPAEVAEAVEAINDEIARFGTAACRLVAVTKGFGPDVVDTVLGCGVDDIGESYAPEVQQKAPNLDDATLHFIGRIQRNKVRKIAELVDLWHSVARLEIIEEIAKRSPGAKILLQVQPVEDQTKDGFADRDVEAAVAHADGLGLDVCGLMTMGVMGDAAATTRTFRALAERADALGLEHRSMGMSGDRLLALEAGSTMIRVGSDLFGPRPR